MTAAPPLVTVDNLAITYGRDERALVAVQGVSFDIAEGEAFGLVGESGCGKSTLAFQLLGYRHPSATATGRVVFRGTDLLGLDRARLERLRGDRVGLVPQDPTTALNPAIRVGSQLAEVLAIHGRAPSRAAAAARAVELFQRVGLPAPERIGRRYAHELSGGQQQRVCIAIALACEPDLVVLDEPTTGLDVTTQEQIIDLLLELRGRLGMSMLYVTHDLGVLAQIADRVGVMYAGHMVEVAPTEELFARPRHPYTQGLIAAIPRLDGAPRPARRLKGYLRRAELPAGCAFAPRCDAAEAECWTTRQVLETIGPGRMVACRRWRDVAAPGADEAPPPEAAPVGAAPVLDVTGLTLRYGAGRYGVGGRLARLVGRVPPIVVSDAGFAIAQGETFALVGESGSGKSTIARAVSGLLEPVAGSIRFAGVPLPPRLAERSRDQLRRIQYVFQNPDASLNPRARVDAILGRPLAMFLGLGGASAGPRIEQALREVRLDAGYARRYPDELSGGERQRIAIARALVAGPTLLLCDEVLSALDVSVQASVLDLLRALKRETRVAMLFISHDLAVVRELADRVGVLFRGTLFETGTVGEVFAPPFHPYTHELLMAVPSAHARRRRVPQRDATAADGPGCPYAGRCPWQVGPVCETTAPPWQDAGGSLRIRCHLPPDELAARAVWRPDGASAAR
ncbi:MAG: dipeptide ABC transporter ATP-binding protein [Alphaproteobacteria bacterium]